MLLMGAHRINHGGFDAQVCQQIVANRALLVGPNTFYGAGVYAYYVDHVPSAFRGDPFVIFQVAPTQRSMDVRHVVIQGQRSGSLSSPGSRFLVLPGAVGSLVSVVILGFINCTSFTSYTGIVYYM